MSMANPSIFLYGPGDARLENQPEPRITDPSDVIVRIKYVAMPNHTPNLDYHGKVHFWQHGGINNKNVSPTSPLVMGHEASGTIHAVGSAITHLRPGDNVAIEPGRPCRICTRCKEGLYNLCISMKFAACPPDTQGCLAKYFKTAGDFCYKLPFGVSLQEGVLAEPLAVAAHAVRMVNVRHGQSVVVFGSGTIGLLCGAMARLFGAKKVIMVDLLQRKLDFALRFIPGVVGTVVPEQGVPVEESAATMVHRFELGLGADAVIEASGAESSIQTAVHVLRPGGSCVQTGLGKAVVNFPILAMSEKELHMHGAFRYGPGDYQVAMDVLEAGSIPVKSLISNIFEFERATEAWEATRQGSGIKNMIRGYGYRESSSSRSAL